MTTKDYIYLGMIVLTAISFYCNGFYAGVYRCKKMYDTLLDDSDQAKSDAENESPADFHASSDNSFATTLPERDQTIAISTRELRGDFGKN